MNDSAGAMILDAFRDSASSYLAGVATNAKGRRLSEITPRIERGVWKALAEAGWMSILVPESSGGLGLELRHLLTVLEELGKRPLPEPVIAAGVLSVALLESLPAGELRDELLEQAISGERAIGVAWQESADQPDTAAPIAAVVTEADACSYVTGVKNWVTPGPDAEGWLVTTQGAEIYWVSADAAGVRVENIQRIDGSSMATVSFAKAVGRKVAGGDVALDAISRAP